MREMRFGLRRGALLNGNLRGQLTAESLADAPRVMSSPWIQPSGSTPRVTVDGTTGTAVGAKICATAEGAHGTIRLGTKLGSLVMIAA